MFNFFHRLSRIFHARASHYDEGSCEERQSPRGFAANQNPPSVHAEPFRIRKKTGKNLIGYLEDHLGRIDYARFRRHGWPVGSGMVESACKWLIQQRFKGPHPSTVVSKIGLFSGSTR
jgi:hypothetical protein